MKSGLIILLSFFIGFGVSNLFRKSTNSIKKEPSEITRMVNKNEISQKIESIAEIDLKEYLSLKQSKEKYEKADEILGKVMVIFLANVGLKAKQNIEQLKEIRKEKKTEETDKEDLEDKESLTLGKELAAGNEDLELISDSSSNDEPVGQKKTYLERVAKKMRYKDLNVLLKAKPFTKNNNLFKKINGRFRGVIKDRKRKDEVLDEDFVLDINYQEVEGKLKGTYVLDISRAGVTYSLKSGNGDNDSIKRDPVNRSYIILEAGPGSYMQLRYLNNRKVFVGNYYENGNVNIVTNVKKD